MGFLVQQEDNGGRAECMQQVTHELSGVLEEFKDVFNMPQGLPPAHEHDHSIILKPGAEIPHIRPYRYPFYQKNEIEKMVREML